MQCSKVLCELLALGNAALELGHDALIEALLLVGGELSKGVELLNAVGAERDGAGEELCRGNVALHVGVNNLALAVEAVEDL